MPIVNADLDLGVPDGRGVWELEQILGCVGASD